MKSALRGMESMTRMSGMVVSPAMTSLRMSGGMIPMAAMRTTFGPTALQIFTAKRNIRKGHILRVGRKFPRGYYNRNVSR